MDNYINSLYYSLSTIAQVLAAFIALSSVFVIFKIQEINKTILSFSMKFHNVFCSLPDVKLNSSAMELTNNLSDFRNLEATSEVFEEMKVLQNRSEAFNNPQGELLKKIFLETNKLYNTKKAIKTLTYISLLVGVITIGYSLIILSTAHTISITSYKCVTRMSNLGSIITILTMTISIILCLKEAGIKKGVFK